MNDDDWIDRLERTAWVVWLVILAFMLIPVLAYAISRVGLAI